MGRKSIFSGAYRAASTCIFFLRRWCCSAGCAAERENACAVPDFPSTAWPSACAGRIAVGRAERTVDESICFDGALAGIAFALSACATFGCAAMGWRSAVKGRFAMHQVDDALFLVALFSDCAALLSGAATVAGVDDFGLIHCSLGSAVSYRLPFMKKSKVLRLDAIAVCMCRCER